jgi:hypothetical protein
VFGGNPKLVAISGLTGLCFFAIANYTDSLQSSNVLAGMLQLGVNSFVFIVWRKAFFRSYRWGKALAFVGMMVPVVLGSVTIIRVLIPALIG